MKRTPDENTGRVIGLAVAFFGALAGMAWMEGVFARLSPGTLNALLLFAIGYAIATYVLDGSVRAWINERVTPRGAALRKAPGKSPGGTRAAT